MKIIFSRHGNTFAPDSPAVWVGCTNDLPLVEAGVEQAKILGRALGQSGVLITAIYCGPLKRTLDYAQIVLEELKSNLKPIVDTRLNELDYGEWAGLTNQQICEKVNGKQLLEKWEKYCEWPTGSGWGHSEHIVRQQALSFATDLTKRHKQEDTILVISSNGKLRYFLNLIDGEFENHVKAGTIKIRTGNICGLTYKNHNWSLDYWNKIPSPDLFIPN